MTVTKGSTPSPSPTGSSSAQDQALQQFLAGMQSGSTTGTGKVYMGQLSGLAGKDVRELSERAQANLLARGGKDNWMSTSAAENLYFNWTDKQRSDFRAKAMLGGLLKQGDGDLEASALWVKLVDQASLYGAQNKKVGPMDLLTGYVKSNSAGGGWIKDPNNNDFQINAMTGQRRYVGPQFKTTTQTNVDLTDPATARALATSIFQQLLGRDPGQNEIAAYAAALQQSEAADPSRATTVTQYDNKGNAIATNTMTSGGMDDAAKAQLAQDQIKKTKEYGATQAATTYMDAISKAVGV